MASTENACWEYSNPVGVHFGAGVFASLGEQLKGRAYAVVTYPDPVFQDLVVRLADIAGKASLVISDVAPNPDYVLLGEQCSRFASAGRVDVIVAIGGGSAIDSAKVFAAAGSDFQVVANWLEQGTGADSLQSTPIIAVPTTAGTGSEVTCWATVWDESKGKKYSLARPGLYPQSAWVDPELMLSMPRGLTVATALDALSHSLESIWNVNANPVSANYAVTAARDVMAYLPQLVDDLGNLELRTHLARAATFAGLAFSNTKTAIAHNISYPITLEHGVPHGIACSFTLPTVLKSVIGTGGDTERSLKAVFGDDLDAGARDLVTFMQNLGVSTRATDYGLKEQEWNEVVEAAFAGERGRNFVGTLDHFQSAARALDTAGVS